MEFLAHLSRQAFAGLDADRHVVDLQGWKCARFDHQFQRHLDAALEQQPVVGPLIVVEVGTWKGLSATSMAAACRARGLDARIVAVDTWLGAPEFWTWGLRDPQRGGSLNPANGWPTVFHTFTKNVKSLGLHDLVSPLPISSVQGAAVLRHHGVRAHIVYVDASHEHDAVAADLVAYWPLLRPGGVMFGDDYCADWPGVVSAVDQFARAHGLAVQTDGVLWSVRKSQ